MKNEMNGVPMESIQRGDQVYYRGEVWWVSDAAYHTIDGACVVISKHGETDLRERLLVDPREVQRVESVR